MLSLRTKRLFLGYVVVFVPACFSPNPEAETLATDGTATTGGATGVAGESEGATFSTSMVTSGSTTVSSATGTTSSGGGTSAQTSGESGSTSVEGRVFVVNALPEGAPVEVCVSKTDDCTGQLQPYQTASLLAVPTGAVEIEISTAAGGTETRVVTFDEREPFLGVVALGVDGTLQARIAAMPESSVEIGHRVVINALVGGGSVDVPSVGELAVWSSVLIEEPRANERQVIDLPGYTYAVTSSRGFEPWAVVLTGDPNLHSRDEASLGAFFIGGEATEFQRQDASAHIVAPLLPSLDGPNVVCVGEEPVLSNVEDLAMQGPLPIRPGANTISLRDGTDCRGAIIVSDSIVLSRASRNLLSFGFATALSVYVDDFSPPSGNTEYRLLNMHTDGDHAWLELRDGTNDALIEVLVADLPPNQESASFSLDADDATITSTGEYFFASSTAASSGFDEWSYEHANGNRVWFVVNENEIVAIDVNTYPWTADGV